MTLRSLELLTKFLLFVATGLWQGWELGTNEKILGKIGLIKKWVWILKFGLNMLCKVKI